MSPLYRIHVYADQKHDCRAVRYEAENLSLTRSLLLISASEWIIRVEYGGLDIVCNLVEHIF